MAELSENVTRLAEAIGPRPGGTEEEQRASFFIEESFQNTGLETMVEEFNCNPHYELPRFACCAVAIVFGMLAAFLQVLVVPSFIITAVAFAVYALEVIGFAPVSRLMSRGLSQNVIAKYSPSHGSASALGENADLQTGEDDDLHTDDSVKYRKSRYLKGAPRKRKVVIVARYDSGRVCRELQKPVFEILPLIQKIVLAGMLVIPICLLIKMFVGGGNAADVVFNIILFIAMVTALAPIVQFVLHQTARFSDGANNNASGVAVMMEVAKRISDTNVAYRHGPAGAAAVNRTIEEVAAIEEVAVEPYGSVVVAEAADNVVIHGEEELAASVDLPPETELVYDTAETLPLDSFAEEDAVFAEAAEAPEDVVDEEAVALEMPGEAVAAIETPVSAAVFAQTDVDIDGEDGEDVDDVIIEEAAASEAPVAIAAEPEAVEVTIEEEAASPADSGEVPIPAPMRSRYATPVADWSYSSPLGSTAPASSTPSAASTSDTAGSKYGSNVPDWFKRGMEKANARKDSEAEAAPRAGRSRLSDALEAAHGGAYAPHATSRRTPAETAPATLEDAISIDLVTEREGIAHMNESSSDGPAEDRSVHPRRSGVDAVFGEAPKPETREVEDSDIRRERVEYSVDVMPSGTSAEETVAEKIAEEAAAADRTISFIPVTPEISAEATAEFESVDASAQREKSASDILEEATAMTEEAETATKAGRARVAARKKRELSLPSLTGAIKGAASAQAAPLAEDAARAAGEQREALMRRQHEQQTLLKSTLPSTDRKPKSQDVFSTNEFADSSLSGVIPIVTDELISESDSTDVLYGENATRSDAEEALNSLDFDYEEESFADSIGLDEDSLSQDLDMEDVDDSHYDEYTTHAGAPAVPGYVDMPKSRASRIKNLFGKKKREEERSFSEAVGLEEGFEARKVGADRGGWESFQNESADYEWNGGALSALRKVKDDIGDKVSTLKEKPSESDRSNRRSRRAGKQADAESMPAASIDIEAEDMIEERESIRRFRRSSRMDDAFAEVAALAKAREDAQAAERADGSFTGTARMYADPYDGAMDAYEAFVSDDEIEMHVEEEVQEAFPIEVWFVALGAELTENAGMRNFLSEHQDELKGSIVIELEAMGAGALSIVDDEGELKQRRTPARMKRYAMKAASALGMRVSPAKMRWRASASYLAAEKGLQAIHLAGYEDGKPAYLGEADDVVANVSEDTMLRNTAYVLELLRTI